MTVIITLQKISVFLGGHSNISNAFDTGFACYRYAIDSHNGIYMIFSFYITCNISFLFLKM